MKFAPLSAAALALGLVAFSSTVAYADAFTVSIEAPGVQNSTASFRYSGIETFNELSTGNNQTFTTTFGTSAHPTVITGTYTNVQINVADQYGGAGGTGNYAVAFGSRPYSLALSTSNGNPITYFGFWLSALDSGNQVTFYNGASQVYSFNPAQVLALTSSEPAYLGNPNTVYLNNAGQPYVFLNFYDTTGSFNNVAFTENPSNGGYESDNHTVGEFTTISGTVVGVPEPASMTLLGAALVGLGLIRRKRT